MPTDKLFAEWFEIERWRDSRAFLLRAEPRGVYREMLSQAWKRGARLPNDPETIQALCNVRPDEWARCWPLIAEFWRVEGDSLVNDTQLEIYADAQGRASRRSEASRKGGLAAAKRRERVDGESWKFSNLIVTPKMHLVILRALGPRATGLDFGAIYNAAALSYLEHGEPDNRLDDLRRRALDAAKAKRESGPPSVAETAARLARERAESIEITPEERAARKAALRGVLSVRS